MNTRFIPAKLKVLFLFVPMLVVGFTPIAPAWSQNDIVPTDPKVLDQLVSRQIITSLQSPHAQVRSQTLKNVIVYATLDFDQIDLGGITALLAGVAEEDASKSNRRLAVAALRSHRFLAGQTASVASGRHGRCGVPVAGCQRAFGVSHDADDQFAVRGPSPKLGSPAKAMLCRAPQGGGPDSGLPLLRMGKMPSGSM